MKISNTISPKTSSLIYLFLISISEGLIAFSGFAVLVFVVSGEISEIDYFPEYLVSLKYLILFFISRFIFACVIQFFKRKLLTQISEHILLKLWLECDKDSKSELNPRLLSTDLLWITQGYESISVFISESIMAIFIIIGLIVNIKLSLIAYPILLFAVLSIALIMLIIRKIIDILTKRIFINGSSFTDEVTYYFKHFLPITLRKSNNEFKKQSRINYYLFLDSVVSKSIVKNLTPISVELIGIITCLLIIFLLDGIDKVAFLAFIIRLISSFNRLSNAYQGIVGKKAIESQININENS